MANTTFAAQTMPNNGGQGTIWRNLSPAIPQSGFVVNKTAVVNQSPLAKAVVTARVSHPNQPITLKVGS